jgi:hypothetical protein
MFSLLFEHLCLGFYNQRRDLGAPRVLKPEATSSLLQISLPYPKGGLRRRHAFIMPLPSCIYVHKIVLQFYVCFAHLSLM